jgi:hypothetical protein
MNLEATLDIHASGTSEGASKAWDTKGRGRNKVDSEKVARAKASYVPVTKDKRQRATINEAVVAKLVGGLHTKDSEEFDVLLPGKKIAVEVKTIFPDAKNDKITMHGPSLERKLMYLASEKYKKAYTVVFNMLDNKVYAGKGLGSFRPSAKSSSVQPISLNKLKGFIK